MMCAALIRDNGESDEGEVGGKSEGSLFLTLPLLSSYLLRSYAELPNMTPFPPKEEPNEDKISLSMRAQSTHIPRGG